MSLKEKLEHIETSIAVPIKLTFQEKKALRSAWKELLGALNQTFNQILDGEREKAYAYMTIMISSIKEADAFLTTERKVQRIQRPRTDAGPILAPPRENGPPQEKPDFNAILNDLSPEQKRKAETYLDCVKQFPEIGDEIVCFDCSPERILGCIKAEDPTIQEPLTSLRDDVEGIGKETPEKRAITKEEIRTQGFRIKA